MEIEVVKAIKGDLSGNIFVATNSMCYQTFNASDFKPGEIYVLPLDPPRDWGMGDDDTGYLPTRSTQPIGRWFELPGCSHSGLAMKGNHLYTTTGYYMNLGLLEFLLPLGLLRSISTWILVLMAIAVPIAILWFKRSRERRAWRRSRGEQAQR